ncbi:hypothetical protein A3G55_04495 [Candidatus Giovannonibacteria bacterium RIFCSPLOWO2_12_FULL_44_25]|uniref:Uncharacterized protein n=2 Tax=Candidatus Giovannoniibacteriota TaxID=1752738 RepID=A0A1F5WA55_9BACT|nr:MAG: hypothetical protein UW15_C0006G0011 [Parcubacteria group bacterium GW2011_GWC1_44_10]KKT59886.1 MAG: hypothetical protein UW53_C0006G0033 [Candidatus Giovannonibacteria bacterium GW2011_GWA1_44_25]KKU29872.1 MAG: hypothetical protein UX43_C0004G0033 [Candidatus Giovannonibacteria bacterium GW2011_GWB1_46_20]OGF48936.1 MAG: hypothetical protein A2120_05025 [Candidatus Giovannonibacteria bacterium GWA2_45_15]OGF59712.1 MAG: hypothetical protein A2W40_01340 [Candidatus Giovannonibacteria 
MKTVDNKKRQAISEALEKLPEDLRGALFAPETTDAVQAVGKKAELTIDKIGELADETGLVMLGITSPSDYVKNLTSRLAVPAEKARAIAEEINKKVFQPVRESLKKIHGLGAPPTPPSSTLSVESKKTPSVFHGGAEPTGGAISKTTPPQPPTPKPLPTHEEIVAPELPPSLWEGEEGGGLVFKPPPPPAILPPIFVKKMPIPDLPPKPDISPAPKEKLPQNSLIAKSELEKALNAEPQPPKKTYQNSDPYREPIE